MEAGIVHQADLEHVEIIQTQHIEMGYYSQKCPLKQTPNEDALGYLSDNKQTLLMVADGVGGSPNGEVASHLSISNAINTLKKLDKLPNDLTTLRNDVLNSLEKTNQQLIHDYVGAKTTLTACIIQEQSLQSLQIGDSCLIVCGQKGLLKYKTQEHSPVGFGVTAGLIKEKDALTHPERHIITNALGEKDLSIEIGPRIELADHDTLLLASDGLFDNFSVEALIEIIRKDSLHDVLTKLSELCQPMRDAEKLKQFNKSDDVSFMVARRINH